jgi:putative PIG3 family NAD(P)H quinone oxidoreductase
MTAIRIKQPGGPEMLVAVTEPVPQPGPGQVLVRVQAAGVNRPDVSQRQGSYPPPPGAPEIPGLELAGIVVAQGPGVTAPALGEAVCGLVAGGGYAEYCVMDTPLCLPMPRGYDPVKAAALPETFMTVWHNVFERARLASGESLLVHGGTSGIGTTAIQLANAFGATVFATAGSDEKCRACLELGADKAFNYRTQDWAALAKEATGGNGVDVILDMVGGSYIAANLNLLAVEGRLSQIAFLGGAKTELNMSPILRKRLTIVGSTLRAQPVENKARIAAALREKVWPLLEAGSVAPVIHKTFPLAEAAAAHALMESSTHVGKIMLSVD